MSTFVVAVKRTMRDQAPADWADQVAGVRGVSLTGGVNPARIQIEATADAIDEVQRRFGYCHVEPLIEHHRNANDPSYLP